MHEKLNTAFGHLRLIDPMTLSCLSAHGRLASTAMLPEAASKAAPQCRDHAACKLHERQKARKLLCTNYRIANFRALWQRRIRQKHLARKTEC